MSMKDHGIGGFGPVPSRQDNGSQAQRPQAPRRTTQRSARSATGLAAGSSIFARMPAYTPVTRAPATPEPAQETYQETYQQPYQPDAYQDAAGQNGYAENGYAEQGYESQGYGDYERQADAGPGEETGNDYAGQSYQNGQTYGDDAYNDANGYNGGYEAEPAANGYDANGYDAGGYESPAGYANGYSSDAALEDASFEVPDFEDASFEDEPLELSDGLNGEEEPVVANGFESYDDEAAASYANGYANGYQGEGYAEPAYGEDQNGQAYNGEAYNGDNQAYAEGYDQGYANGAYQDEHAAYGDAAYEQGEGYDPQAHDAQAYGDEAYQQGYQQNGYDHDQAAYHDGYAGEVQDTGYDPHHALQNFDAPYDQAPQIPIGAHPQQDAQFGDDAQFFEGEQADADFIAAEEVAKAKGGSFLRSRSLAMVTAALLGAVALGGAMAFAYKQFGGGGQGGQPPLITADNAPVKEAPKNPGGDASPEKHKLIYDRLTANDQTETDRLVPRQEQLALPNMPAATNIPNADATASTTPAPSNTSATAADGGPRKVKTLVVRPDGSVEQPALTQTAAATAPAATAAIPPIPTPAPKPPVQTQAAASAPTRVASVEHKYVVQVASKRNQTEALASFADMQQPAVEIPPHGAARESGLQGRVVSPANWSHGRAQPSVAPVQPAQKPGLERLPRDDAVGEHGKPGLDPGSIRL